MAGWVRVPPGLCAAPRLRLLDDALAFVAGLPPKPGSPPDPESPP